MQSNKKILLRGKEWSYHSTGTGIPCLVIGISPLYLSIPSSTLTEKMKFIQVPLYCEKEHPSFDVSQLTKEDLVTDIDKIRQELGYEKIAIIAHSGNGFIALEYALKFPQHVLFNILIAAMPCWSKEFAAARSNFFQNEFFQKNASTERKAALQKSLALFEQQKQNLSPDEIYVAQSIAMTPLLWLDPNYDTTGLWAKMNVNGIFFNYFFSKIFFGYDNRKEYKNLKTPTFLALGEQDFIFSPSDWGFAKPINSICMHIFKQSAHYPMPEEQELFDKAVSNWLEKLSQ
jgi:proline iminopeptidase